MLRGHDGASVRGDVSARRRRVLMIPGAFERHSTVSKRIPREKQRSEEVKKRAQRK